MGEHCHACGQRFHDGRLTLRVVWGWFAHDVLDLDSGLLRAMREMTLRPGEMIRSYVAGQRQRYGNPFTYLFLAAALSLVIWTLLAGPVAEEMKATIIRTAHRMTRLSPDEQQRWIDLQIGLVPYSAQIGLAMCLAFVVLLRWFFRKSGYNFAEIFVFGLFSTGHVFFLSSIGTLVLLPFTTSYTIHTGLTLALYPIVYTHAALGFFGRRFATVVKVLVAFALSFVLYWSGQSAALRAYVHFTT
jgi:hypothetical protein